MIRIEAGAQAHEQSTMVVERRLSDRKKSKTQQALPEEQPTIEDCLSIQLQNNTGRPSATYIPSAAALSGPFTHCTRPWPDGITPEIKMIGVYFYLLMYKNISKNCVP